MKTKQIIEDYKDSTVTKRRKRVGATQQKIMLLLLGGLTLGLTHSPTQYFRVVRAIKKEWMSIDRNTLNYAVRSLYKSRLVSAKENSDGTLSLHLSAEGKEYALRYDLDALVIKQPGHWDGKWRMVMFDVPENLKSVRESLRYHFKKMGFVEFQKSVFIHPYPCSGEVEFVMEFYHARRYVRFITALEIDNALTYKKHFDLA